VLTISAKTFLKNRGLGRSGKIRESQEEIAY
jgi:hypothetical protein